MKRNRILRYAAAVMVSLVTFVVYLPALGNGFVNWDDGDYVYDNPFIRNLDLKTLKWAFFDFYSGNWHPLTWISHALDYAVWGLNPLGHHLTNIVVHSANAFLVVIVAAMLVEMAGKRSPGRETASSADDHSALIAASTAGLLFGIHPLHVESVAWVSERKDVLCAFFFLLSVRSYLSYVADRFHEGYKSDKSNRTYRHYFFSLIFFVLALLSKPMAVTLPVVLLLIDWYPGGRIVSLKTFRTALVEKVPFFGLSIFSSVVTVLAQASGKAIAPFDFQPLPVRLAVAARALVTYISKMLFPVDLIPFYPYPQNVSLFSLHYLWYLLAVIVCAAACIAVSRRHKIWPAAAGYYVVTLLPVLGIIQVGGQSMADRYTYLPSIGPFIVLGLGAAWAYRKAGRVIPRGRGPALAAAGIVLVFLLAHATTGQIRVWKNSETLWDYVIRKEPSAVTPAYYNLGLFYGRQGKLEPAIRNFSEAIEINPRFDMAYNNRGTARYLLGRFDEALSDFNRAIRLNPDNAEAYINRGYIYLRKGEKERAVSDLQKGCSLGNETGCRALRDLSR